MKPSLEWRFLIEHKKDNWLKIVEFNMEWSWNTKIFIAPLIY